MGKKSMITGKLLTCAFGLLIAAAMAPQVASADTMYSGSVEMKEPLVEAVEQVEYGAEWNHGSVPTVTGWSYLMSGSHDHSSTVTAGADTSFDSKPAGVQSVAQLWVKFLSTFNTYYNIW